MSAQCQYEKWYCFLFYPLGTQKSSSTIQAGAKLNKPFAEIALIDSTFFASTGHDLVNFNKKYQLAPFLTLKGFKTTAHNQSTYLRGSESASIEIPSFIVKVPLNVCFEAF